MLFLVIYTMWVHCDGDGDSDGDGDGNGDGDGDGDDDLYYEIQRKS